MKRTNVLIVCAIVGMVPLLGCGPRRGTVQGTVTYKKQPLTHGEVIIIGKDGQPMPAGKIGGDGRYEVKGVIHGEALVAVIQRDKNVKSPSEIRQEWKDKGLDPPPGTDFFVRSNSTIPEKYGEHSTSGLTVSVTRSVTQFDIDLTDEP